MRQERQRQSRARWRDSATARMPARSLEEREHRGFLNELASDRVARALMRRTNDYAIVRETASGEDRRREQSAIRAGIEVANVFAGARVRRLDIGFVGVCVCIVVGIRVVVSVLVG